MKYFSFLILFLPFVSLGQIANDDCSTAQSINIGTISNTTSYDIDLTNAQQQYYGAPSCYPPQCTGGAGSGCGIILKDAWYSFEAPASGIIFIDRDEGDNSFVDVKMSLYTSCEQDPFICSESNVMIAENLNPGQTYLLNFWIDWPFTDNFPDDDWTGTFKIIDVEYFDYDCPSARITEIHYENMGDDIEEFIEVTAFGGESLAGYTLEVHPEGENLANLDFVHVFDGNSTPVAGTSISVDTVLYPENYEYFGFIIESYLPNGITAISLKNPAGELVDLISYEGELIVDGVLSNDILVQENSADDVNMSLRCQDVQGHSQWARSTARTPNQYNAELPLYNEAASVSWQGGNGFWSSSNWADVLGNTDLSIFDGSDVSISSGHVTVSSTQSNGEECYNNTSTNENETNIKSLNADGDVTIEALGSLFATEFLNFNANLDLKNEVTSPIVTVDQLDIGDASIESATIFGNATINNVSVDIEGLAGAGVSGGHDVLVISNDLTINGQVNLSVTGSYPLGTEIPLIEYGSFDQEIDETNLPVGWILEDDKSTNQIKAVRATRPANDLCSGAINLPISISSTPSISGASNHFGLSDGDNACNDGSGAIGVWYTFTIPEEATYSMIASNYTDIVDLQLFQGSCNSLDPLSCGTDQLVYLLEEGTDYYLLATARNYQTTDFDLSLVPYESPVVDLDGIGVNLENPISSLDIKGSIRIGNDSTEMPGVLRYRRNSFEGFDGVQWKSLDKSNDNLGNHTATQNIDANNFLISNLSLPQQPEDAATKSYVDAHSDGDADPTNELQSLSINGSLLTLVNGNSVTLPSTSTISWADVTGKPSGFQDDVDDVNDSDSDPDNERITTMSLSSETVNITEGTTTAMLDLSPIATQWSNLTNDEIHYSAGQVGLGVSSSINDRLHIRSSSGENALRVQVGSATKLRVFANGGVALGSNPSSMEANSVYIAGNLGVGKTFPDEKLHVNGGVMIEKNSASGDPTLNLVETSASGTTEDFIRLYMENESGNRAVIAARPRTDTDDSQLNFFLDGSGDVMIIQGDEKIAMHRSSASHPLHIGDNTSNGNGAHVTAGGTWTNGSSRSFKENITTVNSALILQKLAELDIATWDYLNSKEGTHIGPIAEDFYKAFGFGNNEKYISTVDADGVALAAIKALHENNQKLQKENDDLNEKLDAQAKLLQSLIERIEKLEE